MSGRAKGEIRHVGICNPVRLDLFTFKARGLEYILKITYWPAFSVLQAQGRAALPPHTWFTYWSYFFHGEMSFMKVETMFHDPSAFPHACELGDIVRGCQREHAEMN